MEHIEPIDIARLRSMAENCFFGIHADTPAEKPLNLSRIARMTDDELADLPDGAYLLSERVMTDKGGIIMLRNALNQPL